MNAQLKKGALELCALALAVRRDRYGYELAQSLAEQIDIAEGTVYPLLRRLTQEGYFTTYMVESAEGPARKYYRITALGRNYLQSGVNEWRRFAAGVEQILGGDTDP